MTLTEAQQAFAATSVGQVPTSVEGTDSLPAPFSTEWLTQPAAGFEDATSAKIAIVDDEPIYFKVVKKYLEDFGYRRFVTISDATRAVDIIGQEQPDVVLLDVLMPGVSGLQILQQIRADRKLKFLPALILTASSDPETRVLALQLGATDFLTKPVNPTELVARVRNALAFKAHKDQLEETIRVRTAEVASCRQEALMCLARAAEYRDDDTGRHVIRVGRYSALIAEEMGFSSEWVALLEQAAQLHDIGKIGIPDSILLKPGKLDSDEFDTIKRHCDYGRKIIQPVFDREWANLRKNTGTPIENSGFSSSPVMRLAASIAESHHEKWDGSGYPRGTAEENIPIEGRITAVADVFDALSTNRPYKPAFPMAKCLEILEEGRGQHFDPQVVSAFMARLDEVKQVHRCYADVE